MDERGDPSLQVLVRAMSLQLQETPRQETPLQEAPLQEAPLQQAPLQEAPIETPLLCDQEQQTCSSLVQVTQLECVCTVFTVY